jgi:putative hydrolase of the HAD superfamily
MITTVFFDLDETLLDDERTAVAAQVKTCRWAAAQRADLDPLRLQAAYHRANHNFWNAYDQANERRNGDEIRRALWLEGLAACSLRDEEFAERLSETYHAMRAGTYALFPDALPCLERLRGTYTLGLITNGASSLQRAKIDALGLETHMDVIVIAGEAGVSKPEAAIFEAALREADCAAAQAAMVGDLLDRDILGAMNAGLLPIWINRHGELGEAGENDVVPATDRVNRAARTPPPRHTISTLDELAGVLRSSVTASDAAAGAVSS